MPEADSRRGRKRARPARVEEVDALAAGRLADADSWLHWWLREPEWESEILCLFGKRRSVPRLVCWFGEPGLNYRYSGTEHLCTGWPLVLEPLRRGISQRCSTPFNFVLANRYRDGADSMGWHTDDEQELLGDVCSVSLGASRRFLLDTPAERLSLNLSHGLVVRIPRHWRHAIPKTTRPVGERINLTFRYLRGVR